MASKVSKKATQPGSVELLAPDYWGQACAALMKQDRILRKIIPKYPQAEFLQTRGDAFQTLARAIVGQQISVKAAQSVWERVLKTVRHFTPSAILKVEMIALREAGL